MPRMVGDKSSIVPVAIGGIIIAAVAVAVWYATRGSQNDTTVVNTGAPTVRVTPQVPGAADNTMENSDAMSGNVADADANATSGVMGAENSAGAMGGNVATPGGAMGAGNTMGGAGNTSPMGSAGADSAGGMDGAGNAASPMTGATPMGGTRPMTGGNAMPVPPPNTTQ